MITVSKFEEPVHFNKAVRQKGKEFLSQHHHPTTVQWNSHAYWQQILPEMRLLHGHLCNYCATWIPHGTGQHSIDHFLDKKSHPQMAYEWDNYRYVSARFNSRKGTRQIVDPIGLAAGVFQLNLINFFVEVNPDLSDKTLAQLANHTIKILKFNDDDLLVKERAKYYLDYLEGEISFKYLEQQVPFIAQEITRQATK